MKKQIFVNGKLVDGKTDHYIPIVNPATKQTIAEVWECTEDSVDAAVKAAAKAFNSWSVTTPSERSSLLIKLANKIEQHSEELAEIESMNVGKPMSIVKGEISSFVENLIYFAGACRNLHGFNTGEYSTGRTSMIRREPIGVVGSITPWNYPLIMAGWKIGPALAAGNTVVLKPSEITPLTTLKMAELSADVLPPGVLNVITGYGETVGSYMVNHPEISMVSLTGSVRAGKEVARNAADSLKKMHLELGGKAPVIVFEDADISAVVKAVRLGGFHNSGQDCTACTRLYISEDIYEQFVSELVPAIESIKVGDPLSPETEMGPLVSEEHFNRVDGFVKRAMSNSHIDVLAGGYKIERNGYYFKPTVFSGARQSDEIIQTEVFGPVITLTPFKDDKDAFTMANDSQYGLAASVWTKNVDRAMKAIKYLDYGTVWVNDHFTLVSEMPHGGFNSSGYGKDLSIYSIEDYTRMKHAMVKFE